MAELVFPAVPKELGVGVRKGWVDSHEVGVMVCEPGVAAQDTPGHRIHPEPKALRPPEKPVRVPRHDEHRLAAGSQRRGYGERVGPADVDLAPFRPVGR